MLFLLRWCELMLEPFQFSLFKKKKKKTNSYPSWLSDWKNSGSYSNNPAHLRFPSISSSFKYFCLIKHMEDYSHENIYIEMKVETSSDGSVFWFFGWIHVVKLFFHSHLDCLTHSLLHFSVFFWVDSCC